MIYLVMCAVNDKTPDTSKVEKMNLEQLFEVCQGHILTACVAYALESAGIKNHEFMQAKEKAVRKNILFDVERRKILNRLEQEQIWYMPLKGSLLKDDYPKLGMRQMSDNDILFDTTYRKQVQKIMTDLGFECVHYGVGWDDSYFKKPVCNFEMHSTLFDSETYGNFHIYYENVKERLIRDDNSNYGYHFTHEDFYLYLLSHEYKHFSNGGTGVRSLLDTYIFMQKFFDVLDWDYINRELEELGIADFERENRKLSMKLFAGEELTDEETKRLEYYIFSGTYGVFENLVKNRVEQYGEGSKVKYVFHRLFPPLEHYKVWFPLAYKYKILIPVVWLYRPIRVIFSNQKCGNNWTRLP